VQDNLTAVSNSWCSYQKTCKLPPPSPVDSVLSCCQPMHIG